MRGIVLSRRAERDLRRVDRGESLDRLRMAMSTLAETGSHPDIKPLTGAEPWLRMRVGDYRIVFRPVDGPEAGAVGANWLVARIVHRRDLERAVATLV